MMKLIPCLAAVLLLISCSDSPVDPSDSTEAPEFVIIPPGEFIMGAGDITSMEPHAPAHIVSLDTYWIDVYEVNNKRFADYLNLSEPAPAYLADWIDLRASRILIEDNKYVVEYGYEKHPVTGVSWTGANYYCAYFRGRLPTEAEWERASRQPCSVDGCDLDSPPGQYPWGTDRPDCDLANVQTDEGYCVGGTAQVDLYRAGASAFLVFNTVGNVSEWVADWYSASYYDVSPSTNPTGPSSGETKVIRGGSWAHTVETTSSVDRTHQPPDVQANTLGFRCAYSENPTGLLPDPRPHWPPSIPIPGR